MLETCIIWCFFYEYFYNVPGTILGKLNFLLPISNASLNYHKNDRNFTNSTMTERAFAHFVWTFFIFCTFWICSCDIIMTCSDFFCINEDNLDTSWQVFFFQSSKCFKSIQLNSKIVSSHFASEVTWNNLEKSIIIHDCRKVSLKLTTSFL